MSEFEPIQWNDFEKVELRVGTIIAVDDFPPEKVGGSAAQELQTEDQGEVADEDIANVN